MKTPAEHHQEQPKSLGQKRGRLGPVRAPSLLHLWLESTGWGGRKPSLPRLFIDLADPLANLGRDLGRTGVEPGAGRSEVWGRTGAEQGRWRELEGAGGWWSALAGGGAECSLKLLKQNLFHTQRDH